MKLLALVVASALANKPEKADKKECKKLGGAAKKECLKNLKSNKERTVGQPECCYTSYEVTAPWESSVEGVYQMTSGSYGGRPVYKMKEGHFLMSYHEQLQAWRISQNINKTVSYVRHPDSADDACPPREGYDEWNGMSWWPDDTIEVVPELIAECKQHAELPVKECPQKLQVLSEDEKRIVGDYEVQGDHEGRPFYKLVGGLKKEPKDENDEPKVVDFFLSYSSVLRTWRFSENISATISYVRSYEEPFCPPLTGYEDWKKPGPRELPLWVKDDTIFVKEKTEKPEPEEPDDEEPEDDDLEPEDEEPSDENPDEEDPDEEKPDGEKPDGEKPDGGKPGGGKPDGEKPDSEKPDGEKPDSGKPDGEKPGGEKPDGGKPDGEKPDGEKPDGGKPDGEKPDGEKPDGEKPDGEKPDECTWKTCKDCQKLSGQCQKKCRKECTRCTEDPPKDCDTCKAFDPVCADKYMVKCKKLCDKPVCTKPTTCDECSSLGSCMKGNRQLCKSLCKPDCGEIPTTCEECAAQSPECFAKKIRSACKKIKNDFISNGGKHKNCKLPKKQKTPKSPRRG